MSDTTAATAAATVAPAAEPIRRNVQVRGRRTSIRMERLLWESLAELCAGEGVTIDQLCSRVDAVRGEAGLTPALRLVMVCYFRERARRHGRADGAMPLDEALATLG